jgi:hypothetical protein
MGLFDGTFVGAAGSRVVRLLGCAMLRGPADLYCAPDPVVGVGKEGKNC